MSDNKKPIIEHYNKVAGGYHEQYNRENLQNINAHYPANYFRLQILLNSFVNKEIKRVIEVGVGEGTPLSTLAKAGIDVWGFDLSNEMVNHSKKKMKENGMDSDHIFWGDIQDSTTYIHALKDGQFDGLMAMGVMPHIENDDLVLENISSLVRPGGTVFIEFRNKLFSLFTFNRLTKDFILNDLLSNVSDEMKEHVAKDLESRLKMDMPSVRDKINGTDTPGYDAILSKYHNPFEVKELFEKHNFEDIKYHWYHYHPAMPYLETRVPDLFREEAIRLEHEASNWRGFFLCSAFVIEAVKREI
jgi:2-polyprenyl-3-methyl-5-hydroxy-6-metoxy-1,4-benzoquinol methylase